MRLTQEFKSSLFISFWIHLLTFLIFKFTFSPSPRAHLNKIEISFFGSLFADYNKKEIAEGRNPFFFLSRKMDMLTGERTATFLNSSFIQEREGSAIPEKPFLSREENIIPKAVPERESQRTFLTRSSETLELKPPLLLIKEMPSSLWNYLGSEEEKLAIKVRFFVTEEGIVRLVELCSFSGNPEWDISVMKRVKGWTFLPTGKGESWYEIEFPSRIMAKKND
ncbi:MAG: TonB C-terminal domain-containing protein [Candidatus Omnitrophica bacterium]|nr:TonB C-terminal domain-containing protein [Candidatus Omnitrophota bacterium]